MKVLMNICFLLFALQIGAQVDNAFVEKEIHLKSQLEALRSAKSDVDKAKLNEIFKASLYEAIQQEGAFEYPFKSLKTIGTIKSPDNAFRLFNWNVEQKDRSNKYYCFVLRYDKKKKKWRVTELIDNSIALSARPDQILYDDNWYGALYYKIIPIEKSGKRMYTVLGLDACSRASHTKLIDVLSFSGSRVKFGSSIFKMRDGTHKRLFFEHSRKAYMSLNYDVERKRIIYDHLSPESPSLEGFYEYYVPDMSYDQLRLHNNKWVLEENVVGVNKGSSRSVAIKYLDPRAKNSGEIRTQDVKNAWIDPTDKKAPSGANVHVAKLPGDEVAKRKSRWDTNSSQEAKKDKKVKKRKDPKGYSMNPFLKSKNKLKGKNRKRQ